MGVEYRFDERSYDALNAADVNWRLAVWVLTSAPPPRVRRHLGAVLQVAALTDAGWLAVLLAEEADDEYLVVGGRWLDEDEVTAMTKITERGEW
jgi:hypothetical protein